MTIDAGGRLWQRCARARGHRCASRGERLRIVVRERLRHHFWYHWGGRGGQELLHALVDPCGYPVRTPAVRGFAILEILALAGRAHEAVLLAGVAGTAHEDTAVGLGLDVLPQDEAWGALDAAIDGLGELRLGRRGDQGY